MGWFGNLFRGDPTKRILAEARSLAADDRLEEAIDRYDAYVDTHPEDIQAFVELSRTLVKAGRADEAADFVFDIEPTAPIVLLAQGEVHASQDELEKALELLGRARKWYELEIGQNFSGPGQYARVGWEEASALYDNVYAELHGHENVVVEHAKRGGLAGRAGVNYRLLGDSLMVDSKHRPESLFLMSVDAMRERYDALPTEERDGTRGLLLLASIAYREGLADDAVEGFEKASEVDGTHFAAFRGLGAAMDMRDENKPRAATLLHAPSPDGWTGLAAVVPDLPMLTQVERAIVLCSIAPLRLALQHLARGGARIRIMPLDVRATDHPEFAHARGERFRDDHRALEALSGVANSELALVRLDELLDVVSEHGWTFAHEFAHIVHHCLSARMLDEVRSMHATARESGYIAGTYAQKNEHEFFAVLYQQYAMRRWLPDLPRRTVDTPLTARLEALFDGLETDASAFEAMETAAKTTPKGPYRENLTVTKKTRCPLCGWRPRPRDRWACDCGHRWNTFDTRGRCPSCGRQWETTACLACRQFSPHEDWYETG